jgi:putative ABC transport system substrate-binding protein
VAQSCSTYDSNHGSVRLVTNLARPGGNVTGLSNQATDIAGKRLALLREIVPNLRKLAILVNIGFAQSALEMDEVRVAARTLGVDLIPLEVRQPQDIVPAFAALKAPADGLYVVSDSLLNAKGAAIDSLALGARLPTIFNNRSFVRDGGLASYGPNIADQYRRAADYVDKILRGTRPSDIPVEQPTKFELVINLKTAKTLGLQIPTTLLATADELIE